MTFKIPKWKHRSQGIKKLTGTNGLATKKKYKIEHNENKPESLKISMREFFKKENSD